MENNDEDSAGNDRSVSFDAQLSILSKTVLNCSLMEQQTVLLVPRGISVFSIPLYEV